MSMKNLLKEDVFRYVASAKVKEDELPEIEKHLSNFNFYKRTSHADKEALQQEGSLYPGYLIVSIQTESGGTEYSLFVLLSDFMERFDSKGEPFLYESRKEFLNLLRFTVVDKTQEEFVRNLLASHNLFSYDSFPLRESLEHLIDNGILGRQLEGVYAVAGDPNIKEIYSLNSRQEKFHEM